MAQAKKIVIQKARPQDGGNEGSGIPPWMATFADMVTLLLCFFILLLSFAEQDLQKFKELLGSLKDGFGVTVQRREADYLALSPSLIKREDYPLNKESKQLLGLVLRIKSIIDEEEDLKKSTGVSADQDGVTLRVDSASMFDPGSAKVSREGRKILDAVVSILKEYNLDLVLRGHTDDKESHGRFASHWELSSSRAAAALEYIAEKGIPPVRLKAVGYADTRPLADNDAPGGRTRNRRVDFYFHRPQNESW